MKHEIQNEGGKVYLSPDSAGEYFNCSRRNIEKLMASGQLPYSKIGRLTRIDRDDLDRLIAAGRVQRGPSPDILCRS